jgi:hypothetical protein
MSFAWRERAARLARQRHALVAEGQAQRALIANAFARLEPSAQRLDVAVRAACYLRTRPWALVLPLLIAVWFAPRRLGRLMVTLVSGVRLWSALRR